MTWITRTIIITTKVQDDLDEGSFAEFVTNLANIVDHTPYDVQIRGPLTISDMCFHTTVDQYEELTNILVEELEHWHDILSDDPNDEQAGLRAASIFHFLCDLGVLGYEAP